MNPDFEKFCHFLTERSVGGRGRGHLSEEIWYNNKSIKSYLLAYSSNRECISCVELCCGEGAGLKTKNEQWLSLPYCHTTTVNQLSFAIYA